jgi:hypothetical protein
MVSRNKIVYYSVLLIISCGVIIMYINKIKIKKKKRKKIKKKIKRINNKNKMKSHELINF